MAFYIWKMERSVEWKISMRNKILFTLSLLGVLFAIFVAVYLNQKSKALPPAFAPASNPYSNGIYAQGIIESAQNSGANVNIYPEVSGVVNQIYVKEGMDVEAGTTLLTIEDSVQKALVAQQAAQIEVARANLNNVTDAYQKLKSVWNVSHDSISKDELDKGKNAVSIAKANFELSQRQFEASRALLDKYQIKALTPGKVLSMNASLGSYVSSQGVFDTYTKQMNPLIIMGAQKQKLAVRCFIDEILIQRLPHLENISAYMYIRGADRQKVPLQFLRIQPNVAPKVQLSDQKTERVDVRVLPIIFTFDVPESLQVYTGQLVDVYIGEEKH
jgi:HlyD family secretion protein